MISPREALTRDQLRGIWERDRSPAVRALLWEIHRLRSVVLRASDFAQMATDKKLDQRMDSLSRTMFSGMRDLLKEEPVVKEDEARRSAR